MVCIGEDPLTTDHSGMAPVEPMAVNCWVVIQTHSEKLQPVLHNRQKHKSGTKTVLWGNRPSTPATLKLPTTSETLFVFEGSAGGSQQKQLLLLKSSH